MQVHKMLVDVMDKLGMKPEKKDGAGKKSNMSSLEDIRARYSKKALFLTAKNTARPCANLCTILSGFGGLLCSSGWRTAGSGAPLRCRSCCRFMVIYTPFLQQAFSTVSLSTGDWARGAEVGSTDGP